MLHVSDVAYDRDRSAEGRAKTDYRRDSDGDMISEGVRPERGMRGRVGAFSSAVSAGTGSVSAEALAVAVPSQSEMRSSRRSASIR